MCRSSGSALSASSSCVTSPPALVLHAEDDLLMLLTGMACAFPQYWLLEWLIPGLGKLMGCTFLLPGKTLLLILR